MTTPPKKELDEKDFIQDSTNENPFPMWLWLFVVAGITLLFGGVGSYFNSFWKKEIKQSPFLQVTNRDISIFLWQFPEHMRVNAKTKNGYLTGFQYENKVTVFLADADKYVVAPPELLFLYHTWKRQISQEFIPTPIPIDQFREFLSYAEEWNPSYWTEAPAGYIKLIGQLSDPSIPSDLATLPQSSLPLIVRQAFQGWRNFFEEGELINKFYPSYAQMAKFIENHPHYARNYWRNIVMKTAPHYLQSLSKGTTHSNTAMPNSELAPFLRVAVWDAERVNH